MTDKFDWDNATPRERDAAVASALGVSLEYPPDRCQRCGWPLCETQEQGCTAAVCSYVVDIAPRQHLPYSTSDAVAFEQVWPDVVNSKNKMLGLGDSSIPYRYAVIEIVEADGMNCDLDYFTQGDTWAEVICKALLILKGVL